MRIKPHQFRLLFLYTNEVFNSNFTLHRSNDWVGISTKGNISDVSVCRHLQEFIVVIMDSHADISFHTRDKYRRGDGFYARYIASHKDLNGMSGY